MSYYTPLFRRRGRWPAGALYIEKRSEKAGGGWEWGGKKGERGFKSVGGSVGQVAGEETRVVGQEAGKCFKMVRGRGSDSG